VTGGPTEIGGPTGVGGPTGAEGDLVVDIGGTKVIAVLVQGGNIVARTRLESRGLAPEVLASRVVVAARGMVQRQGIGLRAALIAVPGTIDREAGVVIAAANLPFRNFPLTSVVSQGLDDVTVILEDDANCGAIGEASAVVPDGAHDLVYITLSTGIGMGSVVGGHLIVGAHGYAGELGHVTVEPGGRLCGCGRRGCLEAYASGRALGSLGTELLESKPEALLASMVEGPQDVTAEAVIAAAEGGDEDCLHIIDHAIALIGGAVRVVQFLIDPEVVVLGGGLMESSFFGSRTIEALRRERVTGKGPTVRASFFGDDSVIVGGMHLLSAALEERLLGGARGAR
jgi:glucokinase